MPVRRRTIITSKILAVTVVSVVGCNGSTGAPATAPANMPATAPASPGTGPSAGRAASADPALVALRDELLPKSRDEAFAALSHYRPLCDHDGFPLVGNVIRKTPTNYTPSEFCSDLRKRGTQ
jgi:hypothetical protein